ncbi:MAG: class I SAM-dependent methyltransferase [Thermoleophilia bacterium]|nr:class I SAM-dependent methyltransferase [Thermoleophilia bacterium]
MLGGLHALPRRSAEDDGNIHAFGHLLSFHHYSTRRAVFSNSHVRTGRRYHYSTARTVWFDGVVKEALEERIPQLVFLGAGYDSRPYRFADLIAGTRVFDVDAPPAQERKRGVLAKAGVAVPDGLAYVPVDFTRDSLRDRLVDAGFDARQETLFVWEGVTLYLVTFTVTDNLGGVGSDTMVLTITDG